MYTKAETWYLTEAGEVIQDKESGATWQLDISRYRQDYDGCGNDDHDYDCGCDDTEWEPEVSYLFMVNRLETGTIVKSYDNPQLAGSTKQFEDWQLVYVGPDYVPTLAQAREVGEAALRSLAKLNMPAVRNR